MSDSPKTSFATPSDQQSLHASDHGSFVCDLFVNLMTFRSPEEGWNVYQVDWDEDTPADSDNLQRRPEGRVVVVAGPVLGKTIHSIATHYDRLPGDFVSVCFSDSELGPPENRSEVFAKFPPRTAVVPVPRISGASGRIRQSRKGPKPRRSFIPFKEGRMSDLGKEQKRSQLQSSEEPVNERILTLVDAFLERLSASRHVIDEIDPDEASDLGAKAAEEVIASARWSRLVGDRIDTSEAVRVLGITRQALSKRQASGSLLGLPGHNTTWFPTWQLDPDKEAIRPEVRDIIGAFRDALGDGADPFLIASWASTAQHEDLEGSSPAEWLADGNEVERLRQAAQRAAERSAQ